MIKIKRHREIMGKNDYIALNSPVMAVFLWSQLMHYQYRKPNLLNKNYYQDKKSQVNLHHTGYFYLKYISTYAAKN